MDRSAVGQTMTWLGQPMRRSRGDEVRALQVTCPKCGAPAGRQCWINPGERARYAHSQRFRLARVGEAATG